MGASATVCVGDFSPLRTGARASADSPSRSQHAHDAELLARVQHIPVPRAGSAVFWDQRVPHANSRRHLGRRAREVVCGGYLPRVGANERYVREQLRRFRLALPPSDFWLEEHRRAAAVVAEEVPAGLPCAAGLVSGKEAGPSPGEGGDAQLLAHLLGLDSGAY